MIKKKIWANSQRTTGIELFSQKIVTKLSKIWVWDPRSGIRKNLFRIPDPGVKKAPDPGSGPATLKQTIPSWKCYFAWNNRLVPYSVDRKEVLHVYFAALLSHFS
jgi:hypothetical protein